MCQYTDFKFERRLGRHFDGFCDGGLNCRAVGPPDVNGGLKSQPEGAGLDELLDLWSGKRIIPISGDVTFRGRTRQ